MQPARWQSPKPDAHVNSKRLRRSASLIFGPPDGEILCPRFSRKRARDAAVIRGSSPYCCGTQELIEAGEALLLTEEPLLTGKWLAGEKLLLQG